MNEPEKTTRSMKFNAKYREVPDLYSLLGMKLHDIFTRKNQESVGDDMVCVIMDFEPVVDLRDDGADELPVYCVSNQGLHKKFQHPYLCVKRNGKEVSDLREAIGKEVVNISTGSYQKTEVFFIQLEPIVPQAPPEQLMTAEEQKRFVQIAKHESHFTDSTKRKVVNLLNKVRARPLGLADSVSDCAEDPEQLMTMEEQRAFVDFAQGRHYGPELIPSAKESKVLNTLCEELVHRLDDRDIENSKSQQAEAPADGSTD